MKYISSIKSKVISLRKKGYSYNEINRKLKIPKSTLSNWLKNLPLSKIAKKKNIDKAKLVWSENIINFNRKKSKIYQANLIKITDKYSKEVPLINTESLFWIGLALFWGEGGKREKWMIRFTNSDPDMIKMILKFFRKICNIPDNKIKLRVHLYPGQDEKKIKMFWSKITNLPANNFWASQTQISKSSKGIRPKNRLPYGTLHITILDSKLVEKIRGWTLGLTKQA